MKRLIIFILVFFQYAYLDAQVTFEQTYNFSGTLTELADDEIKYFVMDVPLNQCRIYNEDHSLFKTINVTVPSSYYLYDMKFITRHLFNSDDNIELLYIYSKLTSVNSEPVYLYGLRVINELGTVLLDLSNGGFAEIKEGSEGAKLLAYQYIYYDGYYLVYTNVYSLGGDTKSASYTTEPLLKIYPNPGSDVVTVTTNPWEQINGGQFIITDMSGRTIKKQPLDPGTNMTRIEIGWMSPGIYVMSLLSKEKLVGAEKFEIK